MAKVKLLRGDVALVDLRGAVGAEKQKKRPCLVVQNSGGNSGSPLTIVAPITGVSGYEGYPQHVRVEGSELGAGGKDPVPECGHIRTIDRDERIDASKAVLAHLTAATMATVDSALKASLGRPRRLLSNRRRAASIREGVRRVVERGDAGFVSA
jgi:mRNA interferase MazF